MFNLGFDSSLARTAKRCGHPQHNNTTTWIDRLLNTPLNTNLLNMRIRSFSKMSGLF
jgi:hypothetical protein